MTERHVRLCASVTTHRPTKAGFELPTRWVTAVPTVDNDTFPELTVTEDDTVTVHVIKPGLSITKTASVSATVAGARQAAKPATLPSHE